ncbi:MAG: phage recombination protein Bet, partial [Leptospiraceae bacterium]|nr:phage recombination protein Bet [Leptospiraceae bacterium]
MNELTVKEEIVTPTKLENYLKIAGVASNLTKEERENFLQIAMDFNLNPFKREIYCTSYGQGEWKKTSIIIGYEVYIKRAERTGQLDGWNVTTTGSVQGNDLKAIITIHRKDRKFPFVHEVEYSEYVQTVIDKDSKKLRPNKIWSEKPITMLKKVATAQGFRLCFSDELGGIPYDNSELPGTMEREVQAAHQIKLLESEKTEEHGQVAGQNEFIEDFIQLIPEKEHTKKNVEGKNFHLKEFFCNEKEN